MEKLEGGQVSDSLDQVKENELSEHARELSKHGAAKGGKARSSVLTPEERSEIARKAVKTRWAKVKGIPLEGGQVSDSLDQVFEVPKGISKSIPQEPISLFQGELQISDISFSCHVLDDGKRVLAQREVVHALTGNRKGGLSRYLEATALRKFVDLERLAKRTVTFVIPGTQYKADGYEATLVIEICEAYLRARDAKALTAQQQHLAKQAEIIVRACAKVGIIALVDEATGYQKVRAETALRLKLQAFISEDMQEWARMFPEEFFFELARLENIHYSPRNRPLRWGKYVLAFVYYAVDKDVTQELKKRTPNPHFRQNLHQWLKQYGREKMSAQLHQVLGVMKTCRDMNDFKQKFGWVFRKSPYQLTFFDLVDTMSSRN